MDVKQVAALASKPYRAVLEAIRCGELVACDLSREGSKRPAYRVHPDDYTDWLRAKRVRPAATMTRISPGPGGRTERASNAGYRDAA